MSNKIYYEGGVYHLDNEKGKEKIYKIINNSKPKRINKLFTDSSVKFSDAPTGTYYFCIDEYSLRLCWSLGEIYYIFEILYKYIFQKVPLFMTVDDEGIYYYVALLPVANSNDVRLVILDRDDPDCLNPINRFADSELNHTVAVVDVIISEYELIKQFNQEFREVYEENKYYISKEYEEKCRKEGAAVCQEYVLLTFKKYIPIFDKYLENPKKFLEKQNNARIWIKQL